LAILVVVALLLFRELFIFMLFQVPIQICLLTKAAIAVGTSEEGDEDNHSLGNDWRGYIWS